MALESIAERLLALKAIAQDSNTQKRVSQAAAFRVIAEYKTRIFVDGLATDLQPIGQYSFTSFYINPNSPQLFGVSSSAIKPAGKKGQTTFKNGNPHKTKYLADLTTKKNTLDKLSTAYKENLLKIEYFNLYNNPIVNTETLIANIDSIAKINNSQWYALNGTW